MVHLLMMTEFSQEQVPQSAPEPAENFTQPGQEAAPSAPSTPRLSSTTNRPTPEELIIEWQAPARPYKKRNRQFYVTIGMIVFLIALILLFAGQFLAVAVVFAFGFLTYVLSAVPPEVVTNQITTYGIRTDGQLYAWEELGRYWFRQKHHQRLLLIEAGRFPNHLTLVLPDDVTDEELDQLMSEVLMYGQPPSTTYDQVSDWLDKIIPLDTDS